MLLFLWRCGPTRLLILEVSWSHTTTHYSRKDSSGRVISSSQRSPPDNTQHSQQTDVHAPGGIRTHVVSTRAAADLRLRPRGYWDRRSYAYQTMMMVMMMNQLKKRQTDGQNFTSIRSTKVCQILYKESVCLCICVHVQYMHIHTNTRTNVQFKKPNSLPIKWNRSKKNSNSIVPCATEAVSNYTF